MNQGSRTLAAGVVAGILALAGGGLVAVGANRPGPEPAAAQPPKPADKPADARRVAGPLDRAVSHKALLAVRTAVWAYYRDKGKLPADIRDKDGKPLLSWRVAILPYMEQRALHNLFKLDQPWDSPANKVPASVLIKAYASGFGDGRMIDAAGYGLTHVRRLSGLSTWSDPGREPALPTVRGTPAVHGLLLAEAGPPTPWAKPDDLPFDPANPPTLTGPFRNVLHAIPVNDSTTAFRPDLTPAEMAKLAAADNKLTAAEFEALALDTPADGAEAKAALDDARFLAERIARLRQMETELLLEQIKRTNPGRRADRAGVVGQYAAELADQLGRLAPEVWNNPVLKDRPDLMAEFEKLGKELQARQAEQKKRGK